MTGPMTGSIRGSACLAVALVLVALAAGCGSGGAVEAERVEVPTSSSDLGQLGAWYAEGTLHLAEREQKVSGLRSFVIAARTVAYKDRKGRLCFTDLSDRTCTDYEPSGALVVSPDGDRLGFLDTAHGAKDSYGTRLMTATVLDLDDGAVLQSSSDHLGDPGEDDLADLYEDATPYFRGFTSAGKGVVEGVDGERHGGRVVARDVPGQTVKLARRAGTVRVVPGAPDFSGDAARTSPDGRFLVTGLVDLPSDLRGVTAPAGRPFRFTGQGAPWDHFGTWSGPHEFLATTGDATTSDQGLQRCDLVTATCRTVATVTIRSCETDTVAFATSTAAD